MEEETKLREPSNGWLKVLGILLMAGSVLAVFALAVIALRNGDKDFLFYDREKGVLLPPQKYATACNALFWTGVGGGLLLFFYEMMQETENITKTIKAVLAVLALILTLYLHAFIASALYVDEGLGIKAEYELQQGYGDEAILIATVKKWRTIQVYYLVNYEGEDRAYWIDGSELKGPKRTYEASKYTEGFYETERMIHVWEEGRDDPRTEFLNFMDFPGLNFY